jgi:hypothetical protein
MQQVSQTVDQQVQEINRSVAIAPQVVVPPASIEAAKPVALAAGADTPKS